MSPRKVAAQCVHVAVNLYKKYHEDHWSCVVLEASDKKFEEAKLEHPEAYVEVDAGYTEVPPDSETVIAWYEEETHEFENPPVPAGVPSGDS